MAQFRIQNQNIAAALDAGSSSLKAIAARKILSGRGFEPLACIERKSEGIRHGQILDFQAASGAIAECLFALEREAKASFSELWVGVSSPFHSFNSYGMAALPLREVRQKDIDLAVETACAVPLPDRHIQMHALPQGFFVDGKLKRASPLKLSGLRLEVQARIVAVHESLRKDFLRALSLAGFQPKGFLHNLVSFSESALLAEQKNEGVCFCDIGSSATQAAVYREGRIQDMFEISIGGERFSKDLAARFKIPLHVARRLKERHGAFLSRRGARERQIEVPEEKLFLSQRMFAETLEKTAKRLFSALKLASGRRKRQRALSGGFVFTGALPFAPGFLPFAEPLFEEPVRLSFQNGGGEKSPFWEKNAFSILSARGHLKPHQTSPAPAARSPWSRLKELF